MSVLCQAVLLLALQQPEYVEVRFHRVVLRNGNFIDGQVLAETPGSVTVRLRSGTMTVPRGQIDRVELVKMRTIKEAPVVLSEPEKGPEASTPSLPNTPPKVSAERRKARGTDASRDVPAAVKDKVEEILERLEKGSNEEKASIGRELIELGPDAGTFLADSLDSLDSGSLSIISGVLVDMKPPGAAPLLLTALKSGRPEVRAQAAVAYAPLAGPADGPTFLAMLNDPEVMVRGAAMDVLAKIGYEAALDPIAALCSSPDASLRQRAFLAVAEIGKKNHLEDRVQSIFTDVLEKLEGKARSDTMMKITQARVRNMVPAYLKYLNDENPQVRASAAFGLGQMGDRSAGDSLLARVPLEQDKWARMYIAEACVKLVVRKAIDPLIEWLDDRDPEIRSAALVSLKQLSGANPGADKASWAAWRAQSPQR
jgi:HEAT repeat protein